MVVTGSLLVVVVLGVMGAAPTGCWFRLTSKLNGGSTGYLWYVGGRCDGCACSVPLGFNLLWVRGARGGSCCWVQLGTCSLLC